MPFLGPHGWGVKFGAAAIGLTALTIISLFVVNIVLWSMFWQVNPLFWIALGLFLFTLALLGLLFLLLGYYSGSTTGTPLAC
jgi:hypothetical protein